MFENIDIEKLSRWKKIILEYVKVIGETKINEMDFGNLSFPMIIDAVLGVEIFQSKKPQPTLREVSAA